MLKPNPQGDVIRRRGLGGDEIMRVEPSQMGLVPLQRDPVRPALLLPYKGIARGQLPMSQEVGSHQTLNLPVS